MGGGGGGFAVRIFLKTGGIQGLDALSYKVQNPHSSEVHSRAPRTDSETEFPKYVAHPLQPKDNINLPGSLVRLCPVQK